MQGLTANIVRWYPHWFLITASIYSNIDVCVQERYYTYLDIWVEWVIRINIKNGNKRSMHALSLTSCYVSITCLLCTHGITFDAGLLIWIYLYTYTLCASWHSLEHLLGSFWLPWTCMFELGLKWSPPLKIKLTSQSNLTSPSSFRTWLFLLARGIFSQLVNIFCIVHIVNFTFVPGCTIIYM